MDEYMSKPMKPGDLFQAINELIPEDDVSPLDFEVEPPGEVFDKRAFMDRMLGDDELARQVAGLFLSYGPELVSAIGQAIARNDPEALTRAVHALKGSAGNFNAQGVAKRMAKLEELAREKDMGDAGGVFSALEKEVNLLWQALASIGAKTSRWKTLIADDDAISRRMLQATLVKWGHDPVVCEDGTAALKALERPGGPRLAILDWMMPGLDGVQLCQKIRKTVRDDYVYIILLTSKDRTEDIIQGLDAGADDYLTKPFDPDELKLRLRQGFWRLDYQGGAIPIDKIDRFKAARDPVTGQLSREGILVSLKRSISFSQKTVSPVSIIVAEPDAFDAINEKYGQTVGEAVIREIAQRISSSVCPQGHVGRYGTGKILVVLPGYERIPAMELAEKLRLSVSSKMTQAKDLTLPVTATLGVALFSGSTTANVEAVILAAETALDRAKKHGPNGLEFEAFTSRFVSDAIPQLEKRPPRSAELDRKLIVTARTGSVSQAKGLLDAGADVNATDREGNTALIEAAFFKYPQIVEYLLERGADAAARNNSGDTALTESIRAGHAEVVQILLPKLSRADLEESLEVIYRALIEATAFGKTEVVRLVKDHLRRWGYDQPPQPQP